MLKKTPFSLIPACCILTASLAEAAPATVEIQTNVGTLMLELDRDKAPITVANFLAYLKEGFYKDTIFHRSVSDQSFFIVQGGGFDRSFQQKSTHDPIVSEAQNGLGNVRGSIAMARTIDPNSATSQFYINVSDNLFFNYSTNNPGYTVFGRVISGMETVDAINKLPVAKNLYNNVAEVFKDLPIVDAAQQTPVHVAAIYLLPAADAGPDQAVTEKATVMLDGAASDPGGAAITRYAWTQTAGPAATLIDADTATPHFVAPAVNADTVLTFQLVVTNAEGKTGTADTATVTVRDDPAGSAGNNPPTVKIITQTVKEGEQATLATQVSDPDGDGIASYVWRQVDGPQVTLSKTDEPTLSFTAPTTGGGTSQLVFSLTVTDDNPDNPQAAMDTATVSIDNNPALLDCSKAFASPARLWPANKRMKPVTIAGVEGPKSRIIVTGVTADEPVKDRKADRELTAPDAKLNAAGKKSPVPENGVLLRAERQMKRKNGAGSGNGRVYAVQFVANDGTQSCTGTVKVEVPPQSGRTAVDDGQHYNATRK